MSINKEIKVKDVNNNYSFMDLSDLRLEKLNHFKGWHCYNGFENLAIGINGDVFGSVCRVGKKLGNIYNNDIELNQSPIVCDLSVCHCGSDVKIKKCKSPSSVVSGKEDYVDSLKSQDIVEFDGNFDLRANKTIFIDWMLSKRCNYSCSYCPPHVHDNFSPHISNEKFKEAFLSLEKLISSGYKLKLTITGGEPTINPGYLGFLVELKDKFKDRLRIITNTNGSRKNEYYFELNKYSAMFFSVHIDYINIHKAIEKIEAIANFRASENITDSDNFFILKIMATPENFDKCYDFYKKIFKFRKSWNDVQVHIEPIVDKEKDFKMRSFTNEQTDIMKKLNQHDKCFTDYMKSKMYEHKPEVIDPKYKRLFELESQLSLV